MIFSEDPLAAALIGAAVELVGFDPGYPDAGESPRDALRRTRPRLALVDCDHDGACQPAFFGPVLMTGARLLLFTSGRARHSADSIATTYSLRTIRLPVDLEVLRAILVTELEAEPGER